MSVYPQYPAISDNLNLIPDVNHHEIKLINIDDEYSVKVREMIELKDFLNLKPV